MEASGLMISPMIVKVCRCCGPLYQHQVRIVTNGVYPRFECISCRRRVDQESRKRVLVRKKKAIEAHAIPVCIVYTCKQCGPLESHQVKSHVRKGRKKITVRCKICCARYQKAYQERIKQNKPPRVKVLGPYVCKNCGPLPDDRLKVSSVKSRNYTIRRCAQCFAKKQDEYNALLRAKRKAKREAKYDR